MNEMNFSRLKSYDPALSDMIISKNKGIYFWFRKSDHSLVYIGIALGVGGLNKRIVLQHLNPKYIEYRTQKHTTKDEFQLKNAVFRKSKNDNKIRKGIDKSAFRKTIGRTLKIKPGEETVKYIINNLYFKFIELNDSEEIRLLEKQLIQKFKPLYNTSYK
jgi:hypothetical protein